jgi:tetrapyrrole methylase family protein / MazG family protein
MDSHRLANALVGLTDLVARLRGPSGCPWDAKQTDRTIKTYLLEEAYEVLEAVERGCPPEVCQELGDLLFQVLFLALLAEERREFDLTDVVEKIHEKMVRRHPHVFGGQKVETAEEVIDNWQKIKRTEKDSSGDPSSPLQSVPLNLPALMRAHRISERAHRAGFDRIGADGAWERVHAAFKGLERAVGEGDAPRIGKATGDLLFTLANLARLRGLNGENLLRAAIRDFVQTFERTEKALSSRGIRMEEAAPKQLLEAMEE